MKRMQKLVAVWAVVLIGVGALYVHATSGSGNVQVTAVFANASPLVKGNLVRAGGVNVGSITGIALSNGKAVVTMSVQRSVLPLHTNASATITTEDLLGERYVNLDRGSPNAPVLAAPLTLDVQRTSRVVDLQDVLNSLNTPTATSLAALLSQAGEGLAGNGANAAKTLAAVSPTMTQARQIVNVLRSQNTLLGQLIDSAAPVANAVATNRGKSLDRLVNGATAALSAVASERAALSTALNELPSTISHARATLAQLAGLTAPATQTLASLRPVTDNLTAISGELSSFSTAANPALTSLPPVLARANTLLRQAAPVVAALRPASASLRSVSASTEHLSTNALSGSSLANLMEFVKGWSLATSGYDAISHYFNAMAVISPSAVGDTVKGILPGLPGNPLSKLPVPTAPSLPLDGLSNLTGSLLGKPKPSSGSGATGLTPSQESGLLGALLGGGL